MTILLPEVPVIPEDPWEEAIPEEPSGSLSPEARALLEKARNILQEWGWIDGMLISPKSGSVCTIGAFAGAYYGRKLVHSEVQGRDIWITGAIDRNRPEFREAISALIRELDPIFWSPLLPELDTGHIVVCMERWNDKQTSVEPILELFDKALA